MVKKRQKEFLFIREHECGFKSLRRIVVAAKDERSAYLDSLVVNFADGFVKSQNTVCRRLAHLSQIAFIQ